MPTSTGWAVQTEIVGVGNALLGPVDELTDGTGGSVDVAMGTAINPYRKSRLERSERRPFMRQLAVAVLPLVTAILFLGPAHAGPTPALPVAPTSFTCSFITVDTVDTIQCTWDVLTGATKYAVDAIANFDLGDALGAQSADFDFGTPDTTVTIPLSSLATDINLDGVDDTPVSVVLRVKGLAPPGRRQFNQHNAFSGTVTCVVSTATCGSL